MAENVANNYSTTLNGAINNSVTSLVVTSATGAPSANFRILIDSEYMLVTAVSGTTFTVTRGIESSTAASHSNGVAVTQIVTAGGLAQFVSDHAASAAILSDTYTNRPSAGTSGRLFLPTDGVGIGRDNGTTWDWWIQGIKTTPPILGNFSWINQGSATATQTGSIIFMTTPGSGSDNVHMMTKSIPTAPYTVTICILPNVNTAVGAYPNCGLVLRESSSGKLIVCCVTRYALNATNTYQLNRYVSEQLKYTNPTTFSAGYVSTEFVQGDDLAGLIWLRITDNNTNRIFYVSRDGVNFVQTFSVGRTDFATPDQIGFHISPATIGSGITLRMSLLSWVES